MMTNNHYRNLRERILHSIKNIITKKEKPKMLSYFNKETGSITVWFGDDSYSVNTSHPEYNEIKQRCENEDESVMELIKKPKLEKPKPTDTGTLTIQGDYTTYNGRTIRNKYMIEIVNRLGGVENDAVRRFVNRVCLNPRMESVQMLMEFLKHCHLPITDDGRFLAYKAVTHDYKDKHTRTIDNSPGQSPEMDRDEVEFDPNVACSRGMHVGTIKYAKGFMSTSNNDRLIICAVDPFDVVSVPYDCNQEKLRAFRYTVIGDYTETLDNRKIYSVEGVEMSWADYISDVRGNKEKIHEWKHDCQNERVDHKQGDDDCDCGECNKCNEGVCDKCGYHDCECCPDCGEVDCTCECNCGENSCDDCLRRKYYDKGGEYWHTCPDCEESLKTSGSEHTSFSYCPHCGCYLD